MKRSVLVTLIIASFIIGFSTTTPAFDYDGPTVKWRFGMTGSPRIGTYAVDWFAKEVEKRTDGKMKVSVQYGGVLASQNQARDAIKSGIMDGGQVRITKIGNTPLGTVCGLPCLCLPDTAKVEDVCEWITRIYTHPLMVEEWSKRWKNKYFFPIVFTPRGIASNVKITKLSEFDGLRFRESKVKGQPFAGLGAVLTWVSTGDLYSAMERKMIDAAAYPCPSSMVAVGLGEVSKYVLHHLDYSYSFNTFAVNENKYNNLPAPIKKVVDEVVAEIPQFLAEDNTRRIEEDWKKLTEKGVEKIEASPEFRAGLKELAAKTYPKWVDNVVKKGGVSRENAEQVLQMVKDVTDEISSRYK